MIVTGQIKSRVFCHVSFKHDDAFEKQIQHELAVRLCDELDFSLDF